MCVFLYITNMTLTRRRTHFSFASRCSPKMDVSLPSAFTTHYQRIYSLFTRFSVGTIICLKHGCRQVVHLDRRVKCEDGGKKDGFGSFSAFWVRIDVFTHLDIAFSSFFYRPIFLLISFWKLALERGLIKLH